MEPRPARQRLSRDDWIDAALERISAGGISAVSVEPIAKRLGTTKGSFYWHFSDRESLVAAALRRWAIEDTERRIERLKEIKEPRSRLRALMSPRSDEPIVSRIDLALNGTSSQESEVLSLIRKHHELWLEFATQTFIEIGLRRSDARHRAALAYSAYLGLVNLELAGIGVAETEHGFRAYLRFVRNLLLDGDDR